MRRERRRDEEAWRGCGARAGGIARSGLLPAVLAGAVLNALPGAQDEAGVPAPPAPPVETPAASGYRGPEDGDRLLAAWLGGGLAERVDLGVASAGGRPLLAVQFGAPGPLPLAARRAILLVGGLDGVSLAGSEAVVEIVGRLLAAPAEMPEDVAFVALPWANPDGLERWRRSSCGEGRNDRPVDEDGDGRLDEDGPDDLDGDGQVLDMLVEDPAGRWVRAADRRFLRSARDGEAPRYRRGREGRDEDGDGLFNEDGPGGVVLDRNFPLAWEGPWSGEPSGPWPLSEPCSRGLADLALGRPVVAALFFQGAHGRLAAPGGRRGGRVAGMAGAIPLAGDEPAFAVLTQLFTAATGRPPQPPLRLAEARGEERPGSPVDWLYLARGVLALEVGVWGPTVPAGRGASEVEAGVREGSFAHGEALDLDPLAGLVESERAWARWLDDTQGGIGFVDWQPVDLGDGRTALVGGWEPRTRDNPPPSALPRALEGLDHFVRAVAAGLPRLEIEVRGTAREGALVRLRARVKNAGRLPAGAGPEPGGSLWLALGEGTALVAGEAATPLANLPGGGAGPEIEWLLTAPAGALVRLLVSSPLVGEVAKEVRLP
ncbi:MAG: M14 family zinc carboxypeptidase [Planctomycetota bacterium]